MKLKRRRRKVRGEPFRPSVYHLPTAFCLPLMSKSTANIFTDKRWCKSKIFFRSKERRLKRTKMMTLTMTRLRSHTIEKCTFQLIQAFAASSAVLAVRFSSSCAVLQANRLFWAFSVFLELLAQLCLCVSLIQCPYHVFQLH